MKKFSGKLYFIFIACLILSLSGCSGHSRSSVGGKSVDTAQIKEVAVLTSPALEVYRDYEIVVSASISGMDGNQYFVAGDIGDEASQATLNLGFSENFDVNSTFAVVNLSTNRVVFAYNPKGTANTWKTGGNISISGGQSLTYNSLSISQNSDTSVTSAALDYDTSDVIAITLNKTIANISSKSVPEYNYVWHAEPTATSEYFTEGINGDKIENASANDDVYIAHDIRYLTENASFTGTATKDGETEYAAYYDSSIANNYIFATLPQSQNSTLSNVKSLMTHSAEEAYNNPVLHIQKSGTYSLTGTWNGQISLEADAVIILNGVTVTCTVAPAFVITEDANNYGIETNVDSSFKTIGKTLLDDLKENKANLIIIADGTTNTFTGSNVYRILKAELKSSVTSTTGNDISAQKKLCKMDGAFYSYRSFAIGGGSKGTGILNITSTSFEGLDSELHLTIDSGNINITAPDDGINVNEDDISVFTQLGGTLTINSKNGDRIDPQGYIVINGGNLNITAGIQKINSAGEAGIDCEKSYYISDSASYTWTATTSENGNNRPGGDGSDVNPPNIDPNLPDSEDENSNSDSDSNSKSKEESYKYSDANVLKAAKQTDKGVTAINIGTGTNLSFIKQDTDPKERNTVSPNGNIFRLDRKINTFSGITYEKD
ncbi:MAG: carbohydrate-binding domain-containing protein [Synergistaceae bacterium]|nr:carbohydrate-binding domain-containing protein [Synergistaceae bacterium]